MSAKKGGLGRGFDSLIPSDVLDETFDPTAGQDGQISELRYLKVADVSPDEDQPRRHFDEEALEELATSIREHGIIQPLVVTPAEGGGYRIVAGERRWRAAGMAGIDKIPAIVRTLTQQHKLELALIENLQRRDLNPLETATAYLKLHTQFNMTYEDIGHRIGGKAVSTISNIMRLLQLPEPAKQALVQGQISEGHARQILALTDEKAQTELLRLIIRDGWSVRKAEQYVVGYKKGDRADAKRQQAVAHTQHETVFTKTLASKLSVPVRHKTTAKGGQIIISYRTEDELKAIEAQLG